MLAWGAHAAVRYRGVIIQKFSQGIRLDALGELL